MDLQLKNFLEGLRMLDVAVQLSFSEGIVMLKSVKPISNIEKDTLMKFGWAHVGGLVWKYKKLSELSKIR